MSRSLPVAALVLSILVACSSSSPSKATTGLQCTVGTSTLVQTPSGGGAPVTIAINGCRILVAAASGCSMSMWDVALEFTGTIEGGTAVTLGLYLDLTTLQQTGTFTGGVTDVGCAPNGLTSYGNWAAPPTATAVVSSMTTWPDPTNTSASPPPSMVSMQLNGLTSAVPFSSGTISGAVVANVTGSAAGGSSSGGSSSGSSSGGSSGGLPGCTPAGGACTRAMDTCCSGSCGLTTTNVCDAEAHL